METRENGITPSDDEILAEAIRLVGEGIAVTFPVNGRSMLPFIVGGRESVILEKPRPAQVGDVVLAHIDNVRYVIHRILKIDGEDVTLMGDGNLYGVERCRLQDIKATATHVVGKDGKRRSLDSKQSRRRANIWRKLQPVRKWLLLVYRIKEKVKKL
jgi:hypothetical protein